MTRLPAGATPHRVTYRDGAEFVEVKGFRRAFNYHPLYREVSGQQRYAFHVHEVPEDAWGAAGVPEPLFGVWPTWHEAVTHAAAVYARKWDGLPE